MSFSDGERPRAPSFARCVVAVVVGGLLKGLTDQAGTVCPLREAEHGLNDGALDLVDARQRVTMWR
jgi:hypothetical protein